MFQQSLKASYFGILGFKIPLLTFLLAVSFPEVGVGSPSHQSFLPL